LDVDIQRSRISLSMKSRPGEKVKHKARKPKEQKKPQKPQRTEKKPQRSEKRPFHNPFADAFNKDK